MSADFLLQMAFLCSGLNLQHDGLSDRALAADIRTAFGPDAVVPVSQQQVWV